VGQAEEEEGKGEEEGCPHAAAGHCCWMGRRVLCLLAWVLSERRPWLPGAGSIPIFTCKHCVGMCGVCVSGGAACVLVRRGRQSQIQQLATWPNNALVLRARAFCCLSNHPNHTKTTGCQLPPLRGEECQRPLLQGHAFATPLAPALPPLSRL